MTLQNPSNVMGDWQWQFLKMAYNNAVETSLGWTLPKYAEIDYNSLMVYVQTIDATETVSVGLLSTESGGDADGLIDDISIATAGWVKPGVTITQGTNANYISATTVGALVLAAACLGANVLGQNAVPVFINHIGDGVAKTLSYTCSSGSDTFAGLLAFRWRQLPDPSFWPSFW